MKRSQKNDVRPKPKTAVLATKHLTNIQHDIFKQYFLCPLIRMCSMKEDNWGHFPFIELFGIIEFTSNLSTWCPLKV